MELNESAISPAAEARVRNAVETAAIDREWEPELYELLKEYDRRATEIEWLRAALASGDTATPTDEQVADALRAWHDLTANQRATWDRLRPQWSLAAFIGHHLRAALAARAPQPAPDEETNDAR